MQNNELLLINDIIYKVYTIENFEEMKETFLKLLSILIPNSAASILMADKKEEKNKLCNPICYPSTFNGIEKNYLNIEDEDYSRWIVLSGKCILIRESDLMPEEERINTSIYKNCYEPFGLHYSLQLSIVYKECFLGIITIYRSKKEGDFTDEEVFTLELLKDHLNYRFYQSYILNTKTTNSYEITNLALKYHLTNREIDVLKLLFNDVPSDDIAEQLCISSHTLKKHIQNLYKKFNVSNRWDLLKYRT